jgi:hypothetical protein
MDPHDGPARKMRDLAVTRGGSRWACGLPMLNTSFQPGLDGWNVMPGRASHVALSCLVNGEDTQIDGDQIGNFASTWSPAVVISFDESMNPAKTLAVGVQEAEQIAVVVADTARSGVRPRIRGRAPRQIAVPFRAVPFRAGPSVRHDRVPRNFGDQGGPGSCARGGRQGPPGQAKALWPVRSRPMSRAWMDSVPS